MIVAGMGWVTPLGAGLAPVWQKLLEGETSPVETIENEINGAVYLVRRVPASATADLPAHPRLRRASAISRFAAAAGLNALRDTAHVSLDRTALVFAIANGGVIYTRRFFAEIVTSGAQSASPLLFPETVFNAPASHLAAILGIQGASYTVVGDGAVGVLALKLAEDLLASNDLDACLVVGAEEIDPLVCEAYRQWRLLRSPRDPTGKHGMILSDGAGALLLQKEGDGIEIEQVDAGTNFFRRTEATVKLRKIIARLGEASFYVTGANGTFVDRMEDRALDDGARRYSPKVSLGESVGASVLWQAIVAAQALRAQTFPGATPNIKLTRVAAIACGLNQQMGGLVLRERVAKQV